MTDLRKHAQILASAAILMLSIPTGSRAQEPTKPISEKGLVTALTIGGLDAKELVEIIDRRGVDFALTGEAEQQLRAAGATDAVIEAVHAHYRQSSPAPAGKESPIPVAMPSVSAPSPRPIAGDTPAMPAQPGVFYREGANWIQLRTESATWHHEGLVHDLNKGGLIHAEISGQIAGTHSPITMHSPASFLIRTGSGALLEDYMLVHLHEKNDNRNFKVAPGGKNSKDAVEFRPAKISDEVYEIEFTQGTGEYAFFTRSIIPGGKKDVRDGQMLTFRIIE